MSDGIKLTVRGLEGVHAQLKELGAQLGATAIRGPGRKAFAPVLASAIARAPNANEETGATGITKKSLRIATHIDTKAGMVAVGITVSKVRGKGIRGDPSWRWHFIEKGTVHQPARPFLRPALDTNAQQVLDVLGPELRKRVERAVRKKRLNDVARAQAAAGGVR